MKPCTRVDTLSKCKECRAFDYCKSVHLRHKSGLVRQVVLTAFAIHAVEGYLFSKG